jgi:alpha-L-arabinofuranosidase
MFSRNYEPLAVQSDVLNNRGDLAVSAQLSRDRKTLVLQVVNFGEQHLTADLELAGFKPQRAAVKVETLAGPLNSRNTAQNTELITPTSRDWSAWRQNARATYTFAPYSVTVMKF